MYLSYSILLTLAAILSSPYWLLLGFRKKKYLQSVRQRLGLRLPCQMVSARPLWLHAVSVGEVLAAKVIFLALRKERPSLPIVISTVTAAGQALARQEMPDAAAIFYFPFDWRFCIRRFLTHLQPCGVVLLETELWPNFLKECRQRTIPVLLANGRISDRSAARYRAFRKFTRLMIRNLTLIGVQTQEDRNRFLGLGATEEMISVTGNLKFDFSAPKIDPESAVIRCARKVLHLEADSPVIVVGSTMRGEEPLMLDAFAKVRTELPEVRMILAPRHPERFPEVAQMLAKSGLSFRHRSDGERAPSPVEVLLLDTIGELRTVYWLASVAVIGGSFLPSFGGHNPLEPAAWGKAIIFGPHMSNFKEMASLFIREQAARQCLPQDLPSTLLDLLRDANARQTLGQLARTTLQRNQGSTQKSLALILPRIG